MQLVTKVGVTVELRNVSTDVSQANLRVGHDRIEVVHQVTLGHHRQLPQVIGVQRREVNFLEPSAVPGGPLNRDRYEFAELRRPLGVQPLSGPRDPFKMLPQLGQQMFNVTLTRRLVGIHSTAPYLRQRARDLLFEDAF